MNFPLHIHEVSFKNRIQRLMVPDQGAVRAFWEQQRSEDIAIPYWARVWPSSIALAEFLLQNQHLIADRRVLEIAGGLGLPSLIAAATAKTVYCTDISADAIAIVKQSAKLNGLTNMHFSLLDWSHEEAILTCDIMLLSDVNYEHESFDALNRLLDRYLAAGTTIVLATPQRLVAGPFIAPLAERGTVYTAQSVHFGGLTQEVIIILLES